MLLLVEPVAAVVTFMAQEERWLSRETVCGQTAAVTGHTAAGPANKNAEGNVFFTKGPELCQAE